MAPSSIIYNVARNYVFPVLEPLGFEVATDCVLRSVNEVDRVYGLVEVVQIGQERFTVEFGFLSAQIHECYGLSVPPAPHPHDCTGCGLFWRLDTFAGRTIGVGWPITGSHELHHTGALFQDLVSVNYPPLHQRFMAIGGWSEYFRSRLAAQEKGRGHLWSMLAYTLLVLPEAPAEEIEGVINAHDAESDRAASQNKLPLHIKRQREMLGRRRR